MNICGIDKLNEIIVDLNLYKGDLLSLDEINDFLKQDHNITLEQLLNGVEDGNIKDDLLYTLDEVYRLNYKHLLNKQFKEVSTRNNIVSSLRSPEVASLFHTMQVAENYFEQSLNEQIVKAAFIGFGDAFVESPKELNDNIKRMKNNLFKNIRTFLGLPPVDLYDAQGEFSQESHDIFVNTIQKFEDYLEKSTLNKIESYSGNKVYGIRANIKNAKSRRLLDAYNAAITLVNFDTIMEKYFSKLISIDYDAFNDFNDSPSNSLKYKLKVKGITTEYWITDEHISESTEQTETKIIKLLISSIKEIDKDGKFTGGYLETKDFYSFAALLKDFELVNYNELKKRSDWIPFNENPEKALDWYITNIKNYHENGDKTSIFAKSFEYKLEFVNSLSHYFKEHKINKKEKNSKGSIKSLFTQLINNSVGATYLIYNANKKTFEEKEMHKHKANEIALQNTIYANILRNVTTFNDEKDKKILKAIMETVPEKIVDKGKIKVDDSFIRKLVGFIKNKLDITLTYDNAKKMLVELSKNGVLTKDVLDSHLTDLYKVVNNSIEDVKTNQEKVTTSYADSDTQSTVIADVINKPIVREVIHRFMDSYIMKPLVNIETLSGEKIPVFKTMTMTYNDVSLLRSQEEYKNKHFKSVFVSSEEPVLLGTGTKLELIADDNNKNSFKWGIAENFTGGFVYDFYKAIDNAGKKMTSTGTPGGFAVTIGNYADKNTVLTKIININSKIRQSEVPIIKESTETILEYLREQSASYYLDLFESIFSQYNDLFTILGKTEYKLNLDFSASMDTFNKNVDAISDYLLHNNLQEDLHEAFELDPSLKFVEEIHYSTYLVGKEKVKGLNQSLVDYYKIFTNSKIFADFVTHQENELVRKHKKAFKSDYINLEPNAKHSAKSYAESVGLDYTDYSKNFEKVEERGKQRTVYHKMTAVIDEKTVLNPLVKKWLWTNALFRTEYLYISGKGEYMHPHKVKDLQYRTGKVTITETNGQKKIEYKADPSGTFANMVKKGFTREISGRLISMAKRNVAFTATIELPHRKTRFGVPENVNVSIIEDYTDNLSTIGGESKRQDVHDGSSQISYLYSKMIDASYPGKGYSGTKKQFGTLITDVGAAIKKDAETVITNDKIRNSQISEINLKQLHYKMHSAIPIGDIKVDRVNIPVKDKYFIKQGRIHRINSYEIANKEITVYTSVYDRNNNFLRDEAITTMVSNLYDIWVAFGAEYSTDENGKFSEGSNDLLYDLITSYKDASGEYQLKNKFIHIIANKSAIKSGSVNLNRSSTWVDAEPLMYATFQHRHMGPQLDANHDADGSQIKEITQVISALAQNANSQITSREIYTDLEKIIREAAEPYRRILFSRGDKDDIFKEVSEKFFDAVTKSENVSLAKTIMESFPPEIQIPYSNQNFFQLFVRDIITRLNNQLITRYYTGLGAVLNPSHKMIQIFEDANGNVFTQSDIVNTALKTYVPTYNTDEEGNQIENILENEQIIAQYIANNFKSKDITIDQIQLGDVIEVHSLTQGENGEQVLIEVKTISSPDDYYKFKDSYNGEKLTKKLGVPRDLKPQNVTFQLGGRAYNIWDLESVKLKWNLKNPKYKPIIKKFADDFNIDVNNTKLLMRYLNAWTQRELDLLNDNKVMKSITDVFFTQTPSGLTDFKLYFGTDSLINDIYEDVVAQYDDTRTFGVTNVVNHAAELILPNIYKTTFNIGNESLADIKLQKEEFFKKKIAKLLDSNDVDNDMKIVLGNDDSVYVRFVDKLPPSDSDVTLKRTREPVEIIKDGTTQTILESVYTRVDSNGEAVYTLPRNAIVKIEAGKEIVYVKAYDVKSFQAPTSTVKYKEINPDMSETIQRFIGSFHGNIKMLVPLMNNTITSARINKANKMVPTNINSYIERAFKNFSGFISSDLLTLDNSWLKTNKADIINQLGSKMYASWLKSQEFIAARIPAQSMQSFMAMQNVGYYNTDSNDAYVSIYQIFLQGSDFDIDKSYIVGYGFDKHGQYDYWSDAFDYRTKEDIDLLESLPIPNGKTAQYTETGLDAQVAFHIYMGYAKSNIELTKAKIFSPEVINSMAKLLRDLDYLRENNAPLNIQKIQVAKEDEGYLKDFLTLINTHNKTKTNRKRNALKNSVVNKIKKVILSPRNFLLANTPVDVQLLKDATDMALKNTEEEILSPWDMFSMYKQQRDAAVGKDDVGISANGLKVFFALSSYYNKKYKEPLTEDVRKDNSSFLKTLYLPGQTQEEPWKEYNIGTISDVNINKSQRIELQKNLGIPKLDVLRSNAAVAMSAFTSAATDNAKELLMAKLNASVELAAMHLYMLSLGITMDQIAIFMNGRVTNTLMEVLETNMFNKEEEVIIPLYLASLKKDPSIDQKELESFKTIYEGAQEFKILARILGVNQKASANITELYKFLSNLNTTMFAREHSIFNLGLSDLKYWNEWRNKSPEEITKLRTKTVESILKANKALGPADADYILQVLDEASSVIYKGEKTSVIGGNFDFRKYMDEENGKAYREQTKKYYNLIKSTVNIFDVIDTVPHFKAMIYGVSISHGILLKTSKKYDFIFGKILELVNNDAKDIQSVNPTIKNMYSNPSLPVKFSDTQISRAILAYDKFVVGKWLSTPDLNKSRYRQIRTPQSISLNVSALLKEAGLPNIVLVSEEIARTTPEYSENGLLNQGYKLVTQEDTDVIVDLMSDQGIANFKILMEQVILQILSKEENLKNNNFVNSLRVQSMKNPFGQYSNQIVCSFNLSQLNNPINVEKFQNLLADFNSLDSTIPLLKNDKGESLHWRDLFYIYNLVVNNEAYGDKRLTPLFEDYIKERSSMGYDYLLFSSKVDEGTVDIFEIDPELEKVGKGNITAEKAQINTLLFYIFHNNGNLTAVDPLTGKLKTLMIRNPNFVINTSLIPSSLTIDKLQNINRIMNWIKSNALVVTFKCD